MRQINKFLFLLILPCFLLTSINAYDLMDDFNFKLMSKNDKKFTVTTSELGYIYSGRIKNWDNGTRIKIFVRDFNDYDQKTLVRNVLGMSNNTFKERVLANKDIKIVKSNQEMGKNLKDNFGSLGILPNGYVVTYTEYGLKIISVVVD